MKKSFKYAFLTCTLAYVIGAVLLFIFFVVESRSGDYIVRDLMTGLTLMLSEFQWWGDFYYLAVLVPWLGSSLVMALLMIWLNRGAGHRRLLGGFSIFAYYLAMILVFIIYGLVDGWGDIGYQLFPIWLIIGFGLGYLAATIAEKIVRFQVSD